MRTNRTTGRTIPLTRPIPRSCGCHACRARNAQGFWRMITVGWTVADEERAEQRAALPPTPTEALDALRAALAARGEDDGA